MSNEQHLQQQLGFKLSPRQIQLFSFLQTPNILLETKLKEEIEKNIVLEFEEDSMPSDVAGTNEDSSNEGETAETNLKENSDFDSDDADSENYILEKEYYPEFDDRRFLHLKENVSFAESLLTQMRSLRLSPKQIQIGTCIIGNLEENGLLLRNKTALVDELLFKHNLEVSEEEFDFVLQQIQSFEPAGVATTSLQQCLLLQLERLKTEAPQEWMDLGKKILQKHYDNFLHKRYNAIQKDLLIDEDVFASVMKHLSQLNPNPGNSDSLVNKAYTIVPDFIVFWDDETIKVELTKSNIRNVKISTYYQRLYQQYQQEKKISKAHKEASNFLKEKIMQAEQLIENMRSRDDILLEAMNIIVKKQLAFFKSGNEIDMKPMVLNDIALQIKMSISTVSKIINSKFVQTDFGIFSLKFFFGESFENKNGDEMNAREIKAVLQEIVDNEDKKNPLGDEDLMKALALKNFVLTRRTITRYRQDLNIATAQMRKIL